MLKIPSRIYLFEKLFAKFTPRLKKLLRYFKTKTPKQACHDWLTVSVYFAVGFETILA
jgi:hypothetical protein